MKTPQIGDIPLDLAESLRPFLADLAGAVQILAGQIGDKSESAIRRTDIKIRSLPPQTVAYAAGAAPTAAEFAKAVDDIAAIRKQLDYLVSVLKGTAGS